MKILQTVDRGAGHGRTALELDKASAVTEVKNAQTGEVTSFIIVIEGQAHHVHANGLTLEDLAEDAEPMEPAKKKPGKAEK